MATTFESDQTEERQQLIKATPRFARMRRFQTEILGDHARVDRLILPAAVPSSFRGQNLDVVPLANAVNNVLGGSLMIALQ